MTTVLLYSLEKGRFQNYWDFRRAASTDADFGFRDAEAAHLPDLMHERDNLSSEQSIHMDYSVGSRVRVKLYSGKVVEAEITAITNQSAGRKVQFLYGSVTTLVNPAQIIEVFKYN
jgi:hypothetical protein